MKGTWQLLDPTALESKLFENLDLVLGLEGEQINTSDMSTLVRVSVGESKYYIKKYHRGGRHFRRRLGRSRVRAEWENSAYFRQIGVPTARLVAFGERRKPSGDRIGALVIEELENTLDMAIVLKSGQQQQQDKLWLGTVTRKIAKYTCLLHEQGFVHGDLKLRNILVNFNQDPEVYIIDCPDGSIKTRFFFDRGVVKDLACLDRTAKEFLSKTQRLRFYKDYKKLDRLRAKDKRTIKHVLTFFEGR